MEQGIKHQIYGVKFDSFMFSQKVESSKSKVFLFQQIHDYSNHVFESYNEKYCCSEQKVP